jgi:preprotein translocase subunit SecE
VPLSSSWRRLLAQIEIAQGGLADAPGDTQTTLIVVVVVVVMALILWGLDTFLGWLDQC